jgi:hypothetical protein
MLEHTSLEELPLQEQLFHLKSKVYNQDIVAIEDASGRTIQT